MEVLGLEDNPRDQSVMHEEFIEQLSRSPEGWYERAFRGKEIILPHPPIRREA